MLIVNQELLNKLRQHGVDKLAAQIVDGLEPERPWHNEKIRTFLTKLNNQTPATLA